MGTDIHGRVQHRWNEKSPYRDVGEIEDGRSYAVFAALAGVRNGFGFAGAPTHTPIIPISEPRGIPDDFPLADGEFYANAPKGEDGDFDHAYWLGDHSHSWLTLSELIAFDWNVGVERCGVVEIDEYRKMQAEGRASPQEWSGDVMGRNVVKAPAEFVETTTGVTHVIVKWAEPLVRENHPFRRWISYLESKYGWELERDHAAVRIVFGFDS